MGPQLRFLAAVALAVQLVSCTGDAPKPEVGHLAPGFTLQGLDGSSYRMEAFRGRVVFVNLWATWCPPCRQEMPSMVALYERFRDQGLVLLAVSEDRDRSALERFVREHGVTFPVLLDEDKRVYNLYRATGVPETHLINKRGFIEKTVIGPFDWTSPAVVEAVTRLLAL